MSVNSQPYIIVDNPLFSLVDTQACLRVKSHRPVSFAFSCRQTRAEDNETFLSGWFFSLFLLWCSIPLSIEGFCAPVINKRGKNENERWGIFCSMRMTWAVVRQAGQHQLSLRLVWFACIPVCSVWSFKPRENKYFSFPPPPPHPFSLAMHSCLHMNQASFQFNAQYVHRKFFCHSAPVEQGAVIDDETLFPSLSTMMWCD